MKPGKGAFSGWGKDWRKFVPFGGPEGYAAAMAAQGGPERPVPPPGAQQKVAAAAAERASERARAAAEGAAAKAAEHKAAAAEAARERGSSPAPVLLPGARWLAAQTKARRVRRGASALEDDSDSDSDEAAAFARAFGLEPPADGGESQRGRGSDAESRGNGSEDEEGGTLRDLTLAALRRLRAACAPPLPRHAVDAADVAAFLRAVPGLSATGLATALAALPASGLEVAHLLRAAPPPPPPPQHGGAPGRPRFDAEGSWKATLLLDGLAVEGTDDRAALLAALEDLAALAARQQWEAQHGATC